MTVADIYAAVIGCDSALRWPYEADTRPPPDRAEIRNLANTKFRLLMKLQGPKFETRGGTGLIRAHSSDNLMREIH